MQYIERGYESFDPEYTEYQFKDYLMDQGVEDVDNLIDQWLMSNDECAS